MIQEFKDFISKGGVFQAAVGLILALAFVPVIDSIVEYILMPIVAAIVGEPDFNSIGFDLGDARIGVGFVITAIVAFVSVAFVLFLLVKAYNHAVAEEEDAGPSEVDLLIEIRDSLANR
jgi:large conductance mechanosensitive channel